MFPYCDGSNLPSRALSNILDSVGLWVKDFPDLNALSSVAPYDQVRQKKLSWEHWRFSSRFHARLNPRICLGGLRNQAWGYHGFYPSNRFSIFAGFVYKWIGWNLDNWFFGEGLITNIALEVFAAMIQCWQQTYFARCLTSYH